MVNKAGEIGTNPTITNVDLVVDIKKGDFSPAPHCK
jgi:hypothetical protein